MSTIKQPTMTGIIKQLIIDQMELVISNFSPCAEFLNEQEKKDIAELTQCLLILNEDKIESIVSKLMLEAGIADDVNIDLICEIKGFRLN